MLIAEYKIPESPVRFFDRILVAKGALEQPMVTLQRFSNLGPDNSGWVIEALQQHLDGSFSVIPAEYENLYAFQLLKIRPALVKALVLPFDYFVVFEGNEIKEITNENNKSIL